MQNRKSQVSSLSDFFQAWFFRFFCFFCLFSSIWTVFGSSACRKQRIWYAFSSRWWMGFHWRESSLACNVGEMILSFATSKTTTPQNQVCKRLAPCRARKNTNRLLHGVICISFSFLDVMTVCLIVLHFLSMFWSLSYVCGTPGPSKWLMISSLFNRSNSFIPVLLSVWVGLLRFLLFGPLAIDAPVDISCRQN